MKHIIDTIKQLLSESRNMRVKLKGGILENIRKLVDTYFEIIKNRRCKIKR